MKKQINDVSIVTALKRAKNEKLKRIYHFITVLILILALCSAFAYIWHEGYMDKIVLPFYKRGNWLLVGIYAVLTLIFFKAYDAFKVGRLKQSEVVFSQITAVLCVNIITYFQISLIGRQFLDAFLMLGLTIFDFVIIFLWTLICNRIHKNLYPPRQLLAVYGGHNAEEIVRKMAVREDKYIISGAIRTDNPFEEICSKILEYDGVVISDVPADLRNDVLKFCFDNSIRAYVSPKISDIILRGAENLQLFDSPLLLCRNQGLALEERIVKRAADIVFSALALLIASPFMCIFALLIKIQDGGPVLYKQVRLTQNSKTFKVCKFRSMVVNAEKNGAQLAGDNDNRITKLGKFLRKTRMDELPQLLNILKGEMSFVGPRPERPEFAEEYYKEFPEFAFRLKVKAGLTGYAQIAGLYDTTPYDKLKMDLMYIQKYSIIKDFHIVLLTIKTVIFPKGK